ncbi:hypothetical protein [Longimicrobium terrae]|uniref:DUF4156 domain-containing protein n=1 Tax=Longimicrobium terrae TaxID=1639882 RepID=A0A841H146_9BACT|nr:hypothetical protein [Longimicrobium terrae]MBB4637403.1 hypothetical protein [Longimicrobium terrae]MBB6071801.1 hypothetical protein [Longimicrobium terrae]NNC28560.1 hypothetical protein [Longimicrobium terrae]
MRALILAGSVLALAACTPTVESASFAAGMAPRPADAPIVIYQQNRPTCAFTEVGWVSGTKTLSATTPDEVLAAMRERARAMGGDAIVGLVSGGESLTVGNEVVQSSALFKGTVVRFNDPGCTT